MESREKMTPQLLDTARNCSNTDCSRLLSLYSREQLPPSDSPHANTPRARDGVYTSGDTHLENGRPLAVRPCRNCSRYVTTWKGSRPRGPASRAHITRLPRVRISPGQLRS